MLMTAPEPPHQGAGHLPIIGRKEYVSFPEWGGVRIRAKIDTGAYSSALDVQSYEVEGAESAGGTVVLHMVVRRSPERIITVRAPLLRMVFVTSSSGVRECRPLIETTIHLGTLPRTIRLTVTNRASLRSRMLLGRQALAGAFLVDVSRKYLLPR
jgi:ribosomal protein S6--L-glutamate ligase